MQNNLRIVGTFNLEDGKFVSVDSNKRDFTSGNPVQIPASQIKNYYPLKSQSKVKTGNLLNSLVIQAGKTYQFPHEKRIVVEATNQHIIYVAVSGRKILPGFYIQKPVGFHSQWLDVMRLSAARKLHSAQVLAEWEVQFLVGVVAGTGWAGLSIVIGVDLFEEAITKKKTESVSKTIRALQVLFSFRTELNKVAPVLTSVLTDLVWVSLLKGQSQHLVPAMTSDPKVAARAAGTLVAQAGKKMIDGRLTVSSLMWAVLSQVGIKAALTIPTAISDTIGSFQPDDMHSVVDKLDELLHSADLVMSEEEKSQIIRELEANPIIISALFKKMLVDLNKPVR